MSFTNFYDSTGLSLRQQQSLVRQYDTYGDLPNANGLATNTIAYLQTGKFIVRNTGSSWASTTLSILDGAVGTAKLADGAVTTLKLRDANVTTDKLADQSVTQAKLDNGSVVGDIIVDGAITTAKLAALAVDSTKLAVDSVTTVKVVDGAISGTKLGDLAVSSTKLQTASVTTAKLADGSVTTPKLGDLAVTSTKLAASSVTTAKLADGAVTDAKTAFTTYGARATFVSTSAQTFTLFLTVQWNVEDRDDGGFFTAPSTRLTVPAGGDGWYQITAGGRISSGAGDAESMVIQKNGTELIAQESDASPDSNIGHSMATLAYLSAGDWVRVQVTDSDVGGSSFQSGNGAHLAMVKVAD